MQGWRVFVQVLPKVQRDASQVDVRLAAGAREATTISDSESNGAASVLMLRLSGMHSLMRLHIFLIFDF
jgi:hypothetical protein